MISERLFSKKLNYEKEDDFYVVSCIFAYANFVWRGDAK